MATHSSTLAWQIPWAEEPGGLQSMGSLGVRHHWATSLWLFTFMHWRRKWQPTPVFLRGESQGWGSLVGCHLWGCTVGHDWSDLAAAAAAFNRCPNFCHIFLFLNFILFNFTILYWFCHISKWICHRYTCVPHPEPSSLLPAYHTIPLGRPSAPAPSIQHCVSNLDWWLVSYMILYIFQCHSPKSSHPLPLPQSPKDCSIHQCFFCCLVYRVIVTIFLNSIYMH